MDRDQQSDFYASLNRHLGEEAAAKQLDGRGRVLWLSERLEDYVDRLHGFSVARSMDIASLVSSDLLRAVDAGVAVLDEHLPAAGAPEQAQTAWRAFKASLDDLRRNPNSGHVEALRTACERFRTAFVTSEREPGLST
jgi:plasmid stabilization system protein ParE